MIKTLHKKKIAIIGSGFSGISTASYLAQAGHEVDVFEKHDIPGGRARQFTTSNGFTFDMGPSWYWMPDVIEQFFKDFDERSEQYFNLVKLNPQFEMIFENESVEIPENYNNLKSLCESIEIGSGKKLDEFMTSAKAKYEISMKDFIMKPCHNITEFFEVSLLQSAVKMNLLSNFRDYVNTFFKNQKLRSLMEFPVIFLGASPKNIPAMYSLMNYGGYYLGTWYPIGGFYELVKAMQNVAEKQGAKFHFNQNVEKINVKNKTANSLTINKMDHKYDYIIASSDYHHTETLLDKEYRNYDESYWKNKTFAPSCLIFYLGINEKIPNLNHHTLFFENDLDLHIDEIYETKKWPEKPLFYVCCPSKTDSTVAPENCENLFLLMPLAININDDENLRKKYLNLMIERIENKTGVKNLHSKIIYEKSYCVSDFKNDYNAYGGNAYGLANTLSQTAILKPKIKNKKVTNLYYTGQLTVPGPGVPPSIISGKIVAQEINKINKF